MTQIQALFVTPPSRLEVYQSLSKDFAAIEPPVWSMLISSYLLKKNYKVQILDAEAELLTHEETAEKIVKINPLITVFMIYGQQPSASTQCMPGAIKTAEILAKKTKRSLKTIALGTHPSALPQRTLEESVFDFVCQGEGPKTIDFLIQYLNNKKKINEIPGLWYFENKKIKSNKMAEMFSDLDQDLPGQSWELIDLNKYKSHNWHAFHDLNSRNKYASLQTSLGCPFKCTFCCINAPFQRNTIRFWSPKHIIDQIEILVEKYSIFNIKIPDEMFVLNPKQVTEICDQIIQRGYGDKLNFWAYARIDTLEDNEMLKKMIKSGFRWLALGIESGSEHVRDGVIKGRFHNKNIFEIVKKVRDLGFYVGANYIFGLPDDNKKSMQETLDLALKINSEWANFYSAMAYPGSQLYSLAKKNSWMLPDDKNGPGWIGYSQHAYESLPLKTFHLKSSEVLDFRDMAFDVYFTNSDYRNLIKKTFGKDTIDNVDLMTKNKLKRKHHFEEVNY
jgi:anaerobic magnesium-protoporphyrin IX monomethyl ester cyclase